MQTLGSVFPAHFLITSISRAVDKRKGTVDGDMVEHLASLYLLLAPIDAVWALDDQIIQNVDKKLGS